MTLLLVPLVALFLLALLRAALRRALTEGPFLCLRVVDGDTIDVLPLGRGGGPDGAPRRVRLLGIDAPETDPTSEKARRDARRLGETPTEHARRGRAARRALERLVSGRRLLLQYRLGRRHGHYGRHLARVWVTDASGRRLCEAGAELRKEGRARLA